MKKALLFISALVLSGAATAQTDGKHAVVNVSNDYTPEVMEVSKKNFTPKDNTKLEGEPMTLIFSKTGQTYNGFTSETDVKDALPQREKQFPGYVRLGYGLTNDIDAKAAYRLAVGKRGTLKAYAGFDGYKCRVDGGYNEWDSRLFKTTAGAGYTHRFKSLTLGVEGAFRNNVFNYRSSEHLLPSLTDKQEGQDYKVAVSGVSNLSGALSFVFNGDFEHITRRYSQGMAARIGETRYGVGGNIDYEMVKGCVSNIGADLRMDAFTYNNTLKNAGKDYSNNFSIDVDPYTLLKLGKWNLKAGVKMNFVTHGSAVFAIAPDIEAKSNIKENFTVYGSITGGRTENGFAKLESITPYWNSNERLKPTYRIVDVNLGTRLSFEPLSIDFNAGYAYTKDDLLETLQPQATSIFALTYVDFGQDDTHHAYADLRLGCDLRSWVKLSADARYDFWSCSNKELLMMKPQITVDANVEGRIIEHLTMRVGYNFTRYTKSGAQGRIANKNDLYARISYQINKRFGAYIQGNNLLNCKYYDYAGYITRGIRGSLGATVNF